MSNDRLRRRTPGVCAQGGPAAARRGALACRHFLLAILLAMLAGLWAPRAARATVVNYPLATSVFEKNNYWTVTGGGVGIDVRAYRPDAGKSGGDGPIAYNYAHCGMSGSTTFSIVAPETISTFSISPKAYGISATKSGNTLTFTLGSSKYLEIQINSLPVFYLLADPIESNPPPSSGSGIYNVVTQYGADKTGTNSATTAINNAISAASGHTAGNGIVYFPAGVYLCGKLTLPTNVWLYFAPGSVLYADPNYAWGGGSNHFIQANSGTTGIQIYGRGTIACRGSKLNSYVDPSHNDGVHKRQINPLNTYGVNGITIYGVILNESTAWTLNFGQNSSNITVTNVKVLNRMDWEWNDGIDTCGSNTADISHCFISTCDDAACVKTGVGGDTHSTHDVTYDDIVADSGHGNGFRVGAETNADIYNVTASNFQVVHCHRGFDLIHWDGGGSWHDIHFTTWRVEHIGDDSGGNATPSAKGNWYLCPLRMEIYNDGSGSGPISYITVTDATFDHDGAYKSYLWGDTTTYNVSHVTFTNLSINGTAVTALNSTYLISKGFVDGSTVTFP